MQRFLLLLACLFSLLAIARTFEVDPFTITQSVEANEVNPVVSGTIFNETVLLGGRRDMIVTRVPGPNNALEATGATVLGFFALSNDVSVQGSVTLVYPGTDGNGFSPVSLIQNGQRCWNFNVIESDYDVRFAALFRNANTNQNTSVSYAITEDVSNAVDVCIPFTDAAAVANVNLIQFGIEALVPNVDTTVGYVCAQPLVSCWHTITAVGSADVDNLVVGDTIEVSVTCQNYEGFLSANQDITASFAFDSAVGTMNQSPTCTGTTSSSVTANTLEFTGSLTPSQEASCTVSIEMIAPGVVDNLAASITTGAGEDPPIRSNEGANLQGSEAFCNAPTLSKIVVTGDEPTAPVQQRCRNQRRCFRLVKQNPCIFASNCVSRKCAVFCLNTPECMLEPLCAGSFWEQV